MGIPSSRHIPVVVGEPCPLGDPVFSGFAQETLVPFPGDIFPFLDVVQNVLESGGVPLGQLHRTASSYVPPEDLVAPTVAGPRDNPFNKRWQTAKHRPEDTGYVHFIELYHTFLREAVRANLGEELILFQRVPTLRVHLGGAQAIGRPHRDADYQHSPFEINYWLPLTDVDGTYSLWTESARDKKDFHPFVASYGQVVRFYGNQNWHYTVHNTSDRTRVSFDFRVIRFSDFHKSGVPIDYSRTPLSREQHRKRGQFGLGNFYDLMGSDGVVPPEKAEEICHSQILLLEQERK